MDKLIKKYEQRLNILKEKSSGEHSEFSKGYYCGKLQEISTFIDALKSIKREAEHG